MFQPALADIPFDLRTLPKPPGPGEIVVTGQRDDRRFRIDTAPVTAPPRASLDLGRIGKVDSDVVQGRMGDAQAVIRLTVPF